MSHASALLTGTGDASPARTSRVVPVLAFAGIVVSLMHTLVISLVPTCPGC